jgi:hypothetical protein
MNMCLFAPVPSDLVPPRRMPARSPEVAAFALSIQRSQRPLEPALTGIQEPAHPSRRRFRPRSRPRRGRGCRLVESAPVLDLSGDADPIRAHRRAPEDIPARDGCDASPSAPVGIQPHRIGIPIRDALPHRGEDGVPGAGVGVGVFDSRHRRERRHPEVLLAKEGQPGSWSRLGHHPRCWLTAGLAEAVVLQSSGRSLLCLPLCIRSRPTSLCCRQALRRGLTLLQPGRNRGTSRSGTQAAPRATKHPGKRPISPPVVPAAYQPNPAACERKPARLGPFRARHSDRRTANADAVTSGIGRARREASRAW